MDPENANEAKPIKHIKTGIIGTSLYEMRPLKTWLQEQEKNIQEEEEAKNQGEKRYFLRIKILEKVYPSTNGKNKIEIKEILETFFQDLKNDEVDILIIILSDIICYRDYFAIIEALKNDYCFLVTVTEISDLQTMKKLGLKSNAFCLRSKKTNEMLKRILKFDQSTPWIGYIHRIFEWLLGFKDSKNDIIKNIEHKICMLELKEKATNQREKLLASQEKAKMLDVEKKRKEEEETKRLEALKEEQENAAKEAECRRKAEIKLLKEQQRKLVDEEKVQETDLNYVSEIISKQKQIMQSDHEILLEKIRVSLAVPPKVNVLIYPKINDVVKDFDTQEIVIDANSKPKIGIIGLTKSGRSTLMGALADGVWPHKISANPIVLEKYDIFKLSYPNNGLIERSSEKNKEIDENFFESKELMNLSALLITVYGSLRDNDYYMLMTTRKYRLPTAIIATKLDEFLENSNKTSIHYLNQDKHLFYYNLEVNDVNDMSDKVFHISALSDIRVAEEGLESEMAKYQQDESLLQKFLKEHGILWKNPFKVE